MNYEYKLIVISKDFLEESGAKDLETLNQTPVVARVALYETFSSEINNRISKLSNEKWEIISHDFLQPESGWVYLSLLLRRPLG